tara:strand:+ start:1502 stop:2479 length:978 start_codon:yes stop_codon:yes gene_type:complete
MKFLSIIYVLFLTSIGDCKTINLNDLEERNGSYYDSNSNALITGQLITKYSSGKIHTIMNFNQGILHGAYEEYNIDGKLLEKGYYKNGKLNGTYITYWDEYNTMNSGDSVVNRVPKNSKNNESYWHNALSKTIGRQVTIETYKDGILNGLFEEYYPNGQLKTKVIYKNGRKDGLYESYWNNGQEKAKNIYKNGIIKDGTYKWFWKNSQLHLVRTYKNGKLEGLYKAFYKHGQLRNTGEYSNNYKNGIFESYWFNGQLRGKEIFRYGIRVDGDFISYWYNGKILERGTYKNGKLEGAYYLFFKNGKLELQKYYNNGVEISCEGHCD